MSCADQHTPENEPEKTKKPKKVVTKFYKKQNELLENFRSDSEQIQKSRQQAAPEDLEAATTSNARAPLLKNIGDGQDMDVIIVPLGSPLPTPRREKKLSESSEKDASRAASRFAMITLLVNVSLMLAKAVASYLSGSLSIISSLVDSCVDITSGLVISICSRLIRKRDPYLYPRGRTRLEPLSLIIISVVMGVASMQLIFDAVQRIYAAYLFDYHGEGEQPKVEMNITTVVIMASTVLIKLTLFIICQK